MAFVMVAGPQIISPVFLATSVGWRKNSAAYLAGAALSISLVVIATYFIVKGLKDAGSSSNNRSSAIDWALLALLVLLAAHTYLTRKTAKPPKWMERLQRATPRFSFELGFVLLGFFPTDIVTSVAVGTRLANGGDPLWHYLGFLALTLLFLAVPATLVLLLGKRAEELLPKVRDWMNTHSWIISEVVILFFIAIEINSLAS